MKPLIVPLFPRPAALAIYEALGAGALSPLRGAPKPKLREENFRVQAIQGEGPKGLGPGFRLTGL